MLLTDKKNRNYAFVTLEDILLSLESNSGLNESDRKDLKKLYHKEEFDGDKIRISKKSKVYHALKKCDSIIDGDTYINSTMLAMSYTRASYEFNYSMKDRLFKYLKRYLDNMAEGKSNVKLTQKILCDDLVMEYIHKYNSFEEYAKHLIGTRIKESKKEEIVIKNRSYVKAA